MELLVRNGLLVVGSEVFYGDIAVSQGKIAALGSDLSGFQASRVIDAEKRLVTPGGVDVHAHLQYHVGGFDTADDFANGTLAALYGGTTTTMDFVETLPEESFAAALERRKAQAQEGIYTDFSLHMSMLPHDLGKLEQVEQLIIDGCPTFKHYMAYGFALDDGQLYRSFNAIAQGHGLAVVHAENWSLIQEFVRRALLEGKSHARNHLHCRPAKAEAEAVHRVLEIARLSGVEVFLFHQSCGEDIPEIQAARERGQVVYAETCPHYFALDSSVFEALGSIPICSPPIRESGQQKPIYEALLNGRLDSVSSDHCPFTKDEKESAPAFNKVPGGLSSIETRMMLTKDIPGMSLPRWVEVCCSNPAHIVGLNEKGQLQVGFDADIVIWSREPYVISAKKLHEQADWSTYEGRCVSAHPEIVVSRGEVVIENGQFKASKGRGRYLNRHLKH